MTPSPGATDDPRRRLLQAARDVVADEGLEGLTLRAIARRAGVSHGAPLRHFPSLATLLAALAAEGFGELMSAIDTAASDPRLSPRHRVALAGQAYVRHAVANPGVFTVMFRQERIATDDPDYQRQGLAAFTQLADLVAEAQADGWRPDDDATELAAVLWSHVHGIAELAIHGALGGVVGPDAIEHIAALSSELVLGVDREDSDL